MKDVWKCLRLERIARYVKVGAIALFVIILLEDKEAKAGLQEKFESGNEAFWSGEFENAIEKYEELVEIGIWDEDVFYNLGTSYARMKRFGHAILNLERALRINPRNEKARENLRSVRRALAKKRNSEGEIADIDPPMSFSITFLKRVNINQFCIAFCVLIVGLFSSLTIRRIIRKEIPKIVLSIVIVIFGIGSVAGGGIIVSKIYFDMKYCEAIAVKEEKALLREGPGERFSRAFVVLEGDQLWVVDKEGIWIQMRNHRGQEGWGKEEEFGIVRKRD